MCVVRFIGCLHLGHEQVAKRRGWENSLQHDEYLIQEWNKIVNKRDLTYILGDITLENNKHYHLLNKLQGRKIVILGNHDKHQNVKDLLNYVDGVAGALKYKGFILTHIPIHPDELKKRFRGNIHAHIHHENKLKELVLNENYLLFSKYFNVDAHFVNYKPQSIEDLLKQ